jgi:methionyl aminopeptidase
MIRIYNVQEIPKIRQSARLARKILDFALKTAQPGMSTEDIDILVHKEIILHQAYPTPINYYGFPKAICTSVNEVVCHGIPDSRKLVEGDILSIDVSVYIDGFHGDNCGTIVVGTPKDEKAQVLIDTTSEALHAAISAIGPGKYAFTFKK